MTPNAHRIWKKIALSTGVPQFQRVSSLRCLDEDAPFTLLQKIIDDKTAPGRLRGLAAEIFVRKTARKQLKESHAETD
jgi:hypothetical protein